jgi:hypothetical protein
MADVAKTAKEWIGEKQRHIDDVNDLLSRLEGMMDRLDPSGADPQVDRDERLLTSALQKYRDHWQSQIDEINAIALCE